MRDPRPRRRTGRRGYHLRKGDHHAEVNALAAAGERAEGGAVMLERAGVEVERGVLEQEALLVLGPWPHSLRTGRPHIIWAYTVGTDESDDRAVTELRRTHDVVIRRDGTIEEGVPGGHGEGAFRLPLPPLGDEPEKALHTLAAAGARTVLIEGATNPAARLLADVVDRLVIDVPVTSPPSGPTAESIPDGYRLTDIQPLGTHVRMTAESALASHDPTSSSPTVWPPLVSPVGWKPSPR
ncbi:hypothetical protein ACH4TX_30705 [Streptomyces sp. NPDC021098]|uniref:hypothetical protein n=1 Tax=unclassified Streptomyces TaxID=2593676 RepID=UPI00379EFBC6